MTVDELVETIDRAEREWVAVRPDRGADGMPCPFCVVSARDATNTVECCPHGSFLCSTCGFVGNPAWCDCVVAGP